MQLVIYGQENCGGCNSVKTFLKAIEREYEYTDIRQADGIRAYSIDFPEGQSVPAAVLYKDNTIHKAIGAELIIKMIRENR